MRHARGTRGRPGAPWPIAAASVAQVAAAAVAVALAVGMAAPRPAAAQAPAGPSPADRVREIADALGAVADAADLGAWQSADDAFNRVLDAIDAHRGALEAEVGDPARAAMTELVDGLPALDAASAAEDAAQVRAVASRLAAGILGMLPGAPEAVAPDRNGSRALEWRARLAEIRRLERLEQWRDMRNAAIDLLDEVTAETPAMASEGGPEVAAELDVLRIFAMRLRAAALALSHDEADRAGRRFDAALEGLLVAQGILPAPTATSEGAGAAGFRAYEVVAERGTRIVVPVVAEGLPDVGLGGYRLVLQWSPAALSLVSVAFASGVGDILRDDARGTLELGLAPAPIGPSGDAVLATLTFDVLDGRARPEDYLPPEPLEALRAMVPAALADVQIGDVPKAADRLSVAYVDFVEGRDRPGSLYRALGAHGASAAPLAERLLRALDLASQPAPADTLVVAIDEVRGALAAAVAARFAGLRGKEGVPIDLVVLSAVDTAGRPLALRPAVPGLVLVGSDLPPTRSAPPEGAAGGTPPPSTEADAPAAPTAAPTAALRVDASGGGAPPGMPRALWAALAVAAAAALLATWRAFDGPGDAS